MREICQKSLVRIWKKNDAVDLQTKVGDSVTLRLPRRPLLFRDKELELLLFPSPIFVSC